MIGSTSNVQNDGNDVVRIVSQKNKQDGTKAELYRVFCFDSDTKTEILEELPDPVQQDKADGQAYKDIVHGFCSREIAQKNGHVTAQGTQNRGCYEIKTAHYLLRQPLYNAV